MTVLSHRSHWRVHARAGVLTITLGLAFASPVTAGSEEKFYQQHNLVSDGFVPADHVDSNLVNPWGMASSPTSPFWVSDNGTGVSTLYNGAGQPFPVGSPLVVTIPPPTGGPATGTPTGQVFNTTTSDFVVTSGVKSGKSFFIF